MTDQPDLAVQEFVFDENTPERKPWTLCGKPIPRSEIVFLSQLLVIFMVISFCIFKLSVSSSNDKDKPVWIALLASALGSIPPNPTLK